MKFEHTSVMNMDNALRGMRNPMNSWDKKDTISGVSFINDFSPACEIVQEVSKKQINNLDNDESLSDIFPDGRVAEYLTQNAILNYYHDSDCEDYVEYCLIGLNDMRLMQNLIRGGGEHRKFMRQIFVSVDITAPLYWWKEADTYQIGVTKNSTSTMHKLASTSITKECFETNGEPLDKEEQDWLNYLEHLRQKYNKTKDKTVWKRLIRDLPESQLQTRTVTMNYENIRNIVSQRREHKLTEWSIDFINWAKSLPYADKLIFYALPKN